MKYTLILLAAGIPLFCLTVFSLFRGVPPPPLPPPTKTIDDARKEVAETEQRVAQDEPWMQHLAAAKLPVLAGGAPPPAENPATEALREASGRWEAARAARALLGKFKDFPPLSENDFKLRAGQLEAVQKRLEGIRDEFNRARDLPGADQVSKQVDKYLTAIKSERAAWATLDDASQLFKDGKYQECRVKLRQLINVERTSKEIAARAAVGEARAAYWQARTQAALVADSLKPPDPNKMEEPQLEKEIAAAQGFLKKYPDAPSELDREAHKKVTDRLDLLSKRWSVVLEERRLREEIAKLVESRNLPEFQDKAASLAKQIAENRLTVNRAELNESARQKIAEWLTTKAFPSKQFPQALIKEVPGYGVPLEGVENNQQRHIGWWKVEQGMLDWRFWRYDRNILGPPERIGLKSLIRPPARPMYVQWAERYNAAVEVLAAGARRADWREFLSKCEAWQKEYGKYQIEWGVNSEPDRSCAGWNFLPDKEVLPHKSLDELAGQLENLGRILPKNIP
jgi:hypothetical protein